MDDGVMDDARSSTDEPPAGRRGRPRPAIMIPAALGRFVASGDRRTGTDSYEGWRRAGRLAVLERAKKPVGYKPVEPKQPS